MEGVRKEGGRKEWGREGLGEGEGKGRSGKGVPVLGTKPSESIKPNSEANR